MKSAWKRALRSVNSMGRAMVHKNNKAGKIKNILEHIDSALSLANGDNMRKAMDMFMAVREDIEAMQVQSRNETESDSSDSDEDSDESGDDDDL